MVDAQATQIKARMVDLTPALAEKLLAKNTHNRSVTLARVDAYAADMRKGDWQVNGEAIKISADGQILDGQHRLMAVLEAKTTIRTLLITGLPAETQETMDQGRARTFADVLKLRGHKHYNTLAAATRMVCLYERIGVPYASGKTHSPSVKEMSGCLARNPEIRESVSVAINTARWWGPSLVAAMHYLFASVDRADADDFVHKVLSGESLTAGDPCYVLRERLIKEHYEGGVNFYVKAAFTVRAWNAYRQGETIGRLVFNPGGSAPDRFPVIDGLAQVRAEVAANDRRTA